MTSTYPTLSKDDLDHIFIHTRHLWEELRDQHIFITGGTGFFGCWLLESLIWANNQLGLNAKATVLSRNPEKFAAKAPYLFQHPVIKFQSGDVRDFPFPKEKFSHIIHAATETNVSMNNESPLVMLETISKGTEHTLDFARHCGAKKVLLTSSGSVYGKQPPALRHMPEDYHGAPDCCSQQSAYGEGKRLAELQSVLYAKEYQFEVKIARCFSFIGPYLPNDGRFAAGNFLHNAMTTGEIMIHGDGTPYRSYLYTADLAIWLWTILFQGKNSEPYNVGSDQEVSITELAEIISKQVTPPARITRVIEPNPACAPKRYVPAINKSATHLNLQVWTSLEDAIKKSIKWHTQ